MRRHPSHHVSGHVSCHDPRHVSSQTSLLAFAIPPDPRHGSCRISRHVSRYGSPLLTSIVTPLVTSVVTSLVTCFATSVVTTLLLSLVITSNASLIMCLDAPRITTPSHLPSCLLWSVMSLATTLPAFRVSSQLRDLKMCPAPSESDSAHPKGFTVRSQHVHRATARSMRPTQSAQRVRFAISKCAPRHSKSDSAHPKCAEGWLCALNMRAIRPTQSAHRVHFACFVSHAQNARRAIARALGPAQSAQMVRFAFSKCAPRHSESDLTHPKCAEGSLRVLKMCTAPQRERSR